MVNRMEDVAVVLQKESMRKISDCEEVRKRQRRPTASVEIKRSPDHAAHKMGEVQEKEGLSESQKSDQSYEKEHTEHKEVKIN